jgi:hypothetical protein
MKTISFNEIQDILKDTANLWCIGERKWTNELSQEVLSNEKNDIRNGNTGIFLHKLIDCSTLDKLYKDCIRLIFFNSELQFQFIATDKSCDSFQFYKSDIEISESTKYEFKSLGNKGDKKSNYSFSFATKLGAIPETLKQSEISVLISDDEWRLYHV